MSVKDYAIKKVIDFISTFIPNGEFEKLKKNVLARMEARAAKTKTKIDDNAVILLKSKEADALLYCVMCEAGAALRKAAKKTGSEIDDAIVEAAIKAAGIKLDDCEPVEDEEAEGEADQGGDAEEGEKEDDQAEGDAEEGEQIPDESSNEDQAEGDAEEQGEKEGDVGQS